VITYVKVVGMWVGRYHYVRFEYYISIVALPLYYLYDPCLLFLQSEGGFCI
jgi:hypothetical protein